MVICDSRLMFEATYVQLLSHKLPIEGLSTHDCSRVVLGIGATFNAYI